MEQYLSNEPVGCFGVKRFIPCQVLDHYSNPATSPLGLISASLSNYERTWHGENRYLLFITENFSALETLKHYIISKSMSQDPVLEGLPSTEIGEDDKKSSDINKPIVLFGSSFPRDNEFTQICKNVGEIRMYMETGRMVILLNLENLYESLYDVLNQYYTIINNTRYVDLGLRTHKMKCTVHEQFKLVLIAEKDTVRNEFPTPLINRLEKHFVNTSTVLSETEKSMCKDLKNWVESFVDTTLGFNVHDAFIGYNQDTAAAVILYATKLLKIREGDTNKPGSTHKILHNSKELLLRLASPDALVRVMQKKPVKECEEMKRLYFNEQEHSSLQLCVKHLQQHIVWKSAGGLLIQVTTHSTLLSNEEIIKLSQALDLSPTQVTRCDLEAFETEYDFTSVIDQAYKEGSNNEHLLILDCDSGHINGNLISCARYRLSDKQTNCRGSHTSVLLLVHLPRKYNCNNFVSFQGEPWICYHIDELMPESDLFKLNEIINEEKPITDIFHPYELTTLSYHEVCQGHGLQGRLFGCIQDVAARLERSTTDDESHSRALISTLQGLLTSPATHGNTINKEFLKNIENLIYQALKNQKDGYEQTQQEWIHKEAMDVDALQKAGTFRNALLRKFDEVITGIFVEVIAYINRYDNLSILTKDANHDLAPLWFKIFTSETLCQHTILKLSSNPRLEIASVQMINEHYFECRFPFSWTIFGVIEVALHESEKHGRVSFELKQAMSEAEKILLKFNTSDLFNRYLYDFVRLTQQIYHTQAEVQYKLMELALSRLVFSKLEDARSLFDQIIIVHKTWQEHKEQFMSFSQLGSQMTLILGSVETAFAKIQTKEMILHLLAVDAALKSKRFEEKSALMKGEAELRSWIQFFYSHQQTIGSILESSSMDLQSNGPSEYVKNLVKNMRLNWQQKWILKLFMEHVILKHSGKIVPARKLYTLLTKTKEPGNTFILDFISGCFIQLEDELISKEVASRQRIDILRKSCWDVCWEVIATHCIGHSNQDVRRQFVEKVISDVFFESTPTAKLSRFRGYICRQPSQIDIIQSRFLKLLLQVTRFDSVVTYLECIMRRIQQNEDNSWLSLKTFCTIFLLYHQDLLMSIYFKCQDAEERVKIINGYLEEGFSALKASRSLTPSYLQGIASIRCGIQLTLEKQIIPLLMNIKPVLSNPADERCRHMLLLLKQVCTIMSVDDENHSGPLWYPLKYVASYWGSTVTQQVTQDEKYSWMNPTDGSVTLVNKNGQFFDPAAVYNSVYCEIRAALRNAEYTGDFDVLEMKAQELSSDHVVEIPLGLALYERIRLSYVSDRPSDELDDEKSQKFLKFVKDTETINSTQFKDAVINVLEKKRIWEFTLTKNSAYNASIIQEVVVHTILVVLANKTSRLIVLLAKLLLSPQELKGTYLPAMMIKFPKSKVPEAPFPECAKHHKYVNDMIGEHCCKCGEVVNFAERNDTDTEQFWALKGYTFMNIGDHKKRVGFSSPVSCAIMRCLLHSCIFWACCSNEVSEGIIDLMERPKCRIEDVLEYVWKFLKEDIEVIADATGVSFDEATLVVHMVLKQMATRRGQSHSGGTTSLDALQDISTRQLWEKEFDTSYIQPVLKDIEQIFITFLEGENTTAKDYSQLFKLLHINELAPTDILFWERSKLVKSDHFHYSFLNLRHKEEHPVLYQFLQESSALQATKNLPDIVKLMKLLQEKLNQRDDKKTIERMKIQHFIGQLDIKDEQNEWRQLLKSLSRAWQLARNHLADYDRLEIKDAYIIENIHEELLMEHLIPTCSGCGVIITALVDFLAITHNRFVRNCHKAVEQSMNRSWLGRKLRVHLTRFNHDNTINYQEQIHSIVLSHTEYRVTREGICTVQYDYSAVEREIAQQFGIGKPEITDITEIPQVVWHKGVTSLRTKMRALLRPKTLVQVPLSPQVKSDILFELKTLPVLASTREVIEMVIKFVCLWKDSPKKRLIDYIEKDLKMQHKYLHRTSKVAEHCNLKHLLSLWRFLSIEIARLHITSDQDPFSFIGDKFRVKLNKDQHLILEKALGKVFDLDHLLEIIYEFIDSKIRYCLEEESLEELMESLDKFISDTGRVRIPHLVEIFRESEVKVGQVLSTWKVIVNFQEEFKKR